MATSEIEKLERRYAENPHGLTFAPLAEVHRKNGDVARALELLTAGLELHPNYIPASIVLGRCHQDLGDLPAAEAAFAHVLRLDDENVIALKSLADINERQENFADAENWLRRLVSVDRSNDEAREQLRRLDERKKAAAEAAPEPVAEPAPALEVIDLEPEPVAGSSKSAVSAAEPEPGPGDRLPADLEALQITPAPERSRPEADREESTATPERAAAEAPAPMTGAEEVAEEPVSAGETVARVAGLISAEFEPPLEAIGGLGVETSEDLVLDASGNTEFRVPDASEDFKALADRLSTPRQPPPEPARSEPAPTREEEESRTSHEPAPGAKPSQSEAAATLGKPAERRSYSARETNGRSVASFFHSLLTARPPAEGSPGGPVVGSEDHKAIPSVFDAGAHSSPPSDIPAPPAAPGTEQKTEGAVSFDDFFGSEQEGSAPARQRADPGKDDLDQFQTWLQNLKR